MSTAARKNLKIPGMCRIHGITVYIYRYSLQTNANSVAVSEIVLYFHDDMLGMCLNLHIRLYCKPLMPVWDSFKVETR